MVAKKTVSKLQLNIKPIPIFFHSFILVSHNMGKGMAMSHRSVMMLKT